MSSFQLFKKWLVQWDDGKHLQWGKKGKHKIKIPRLNISVWLYCFGDLMLLFRNKQIVFLDLIDLLLLFF